MIKRIIAAFIFLLIVTSCTPQTNCSNLQTNETCTRVLFIGNSYTYVNDLPGTFAGLARAGGYKVETGMSAVGGWTLADHVQSAQTLDLLNSEKWDYAILQEQSQIPSVAQSRLYTMYPAARTLISDIVKRGIIPVFFLTWARRDGWPEYGMQSYADMQAQIDQGYLGIAEELHIPVAPVGEAWSAVYTQDPSLVLWQDDGSHPTELGTYLAACVFYAAIFHQTPLGLKYFPHLSRAVATILQTVAANTVLENPAQWHLP
jgi:hypothetical protein